MFRETRKLLVTEAGLCVKCQNAKVGRCCDVLFKRRVGLLITICPTSGESYDFLMILK